MQTTDRQESGTYISDITRTWPVNGKFTGPQRDLYNAVLNVHRSCISLCRADAGNSLDQLHRIAENGLKDQLKQLGFDVSGDVRAEPYYTGLRLTAQTMNVLFPHHVGHYVGLDVHDCAGYARGSALRAGQCITIEPYASLELPNVSNFLSGIYVPDSDRYPERFRGIGIRIEDSVCVGDEDPIVLTPEAVKEVC